MIIRPTHSKTLTVGALVAASILALSANQANAAINLLANGGFEDFASSPNYYNVGTNGDHATPAGFGWSVIDNNVDLVTYAGIYGATGGAQFGDQFLDLVGYNDTGGIAQSFKTDVGASYTLTFSYANNYGSAPFAAADFGVLSGGAQLFGNVSHTSSSRSDLDWSTYTSQFIAGDTVSTLSFLTTFGEDSGGIYLDNVSVTRSGATEQEPPPIDSQPISSGVPEPSTWAMLISGFGMMGLSLRRRGVMIRARA